MMQAEKLFWMKKDDKRVEKMQNEKISRQSNFRAVRSESGDTKKVLSGFDF